MNLYLKRQLAARINELMKQLDVTQLNVYIKSGCINKIFRKSAEQLPQYGITCLESQDPKRPYVFIHNHFAKNKTVVTIHYDMLYNRLADNAKLLFDNEVS